MKQGAGRTMRGLAALAVWAASVAGAAEIPEGGPLTLEACLTAALEESPALAAADQRVAAARAGITQARSAWMPMIRAGAAYQITDNPPQAFMMELNQRVLDMRDPAFDPNQPEDTDNLRLGVSAGWRLFDSGVRGLDIRMAEGQAAAREQMSAAARHALAFEVVRAYHAALQARAMTDVAQVALHALGESLRVAEARVEQGAALRGDVLDIRVRQAEAREQLVSAENGYRLALSALNAAIGREVARVERPLADVPPPPDGEPAADFARIEQRPEWRAAREATAVRRAALRKAGRGHAPVVNAFGSADWDSGNGTDYEQSYLGGVAAEINLFDGALTRGRTAEARAELAAAEADEAELRSRLKLDLESAWLLAAGARERVRLTGESVAAASEAARLARERYAGGAATVTELLAAETAESAARGRDVAARYDYLTALSGIARAEGRLLDGRGEGGGDTVAVPPGQLSPIAGVVSSHPARGEGSPQGRERSDREGADSSLRSE